MTHDRANPRGGYFTFGSYGRVVFASDLRGHPARLTNLAAHGPRLDEQNYAELELRRYDRLGPVHTRVVATLAVDGPLFHSTGTFDTRLAVRNLYIEETGAFVPGLSFWLGSRMYRGDDIYLLNFWPLDNLNTVGGGARYDAGSHVTVQAHVGTNRLDQPYQYQTIRVAPRTGYGALTVPLLDRIRAVGSAKVTWWAMGRDARAGVRVSLHGELHGLPEGERQIAETGRRQTLPSDFGGAIGAQVSVYSGVRDGFVNLFFRYAQGLAAYGDLAVPYTVTASQTSERARNVTLGLAGNLEHEFFGVILGAYVRYFRDADAALYGRNESWEGVLDVRPTVWVGRWFGVSLDASYQRVVYNMVDPVTGEGAAGGTVWRFGLIPFITPFGRGSFTRPHIRAMYTVSLRDDAALRLYAPDDPAGYFNVEHFLGGSCEWWFDSSYR